MRRLRLRAAPRAACPRPPHRRAPPRDSPCVGMARAAARRCGDRCRAPPHAHARASPTPHATPRLRRGHPLLRAHRRPRPSLRLRRPRGRSSRGHAAHSGFFPHAAARPPRQRGPCDGFLLFEPDRARGCSRRLRFPGRPPFRRRSRPRSRPPSRCSRRARSPSYATAPASRSRSRCSRRSRRSGSSPSRAAGFIHARCY